MCTSTFQTHNFCYVTLYDSVAQNTTFSFTQNNLEFSRLTYLIFIASQCVNVYPNARSYFTFHNSFFLLTNETCIRQLKTYFSTYQNQTFYVQVLTHYLITAFFSFLLLLYFLIINKTRKPGVKIHIF